MNRLTLRKTVHHRFHGMVQNSSRWLHRFDPELDALEDFATNFGRGYGQRVDGTLLALAGGLCGLLLLAISV